MRRMEVQEVIMVKNMGMVDRVLRVAAAVVIAILYFTGAIGGALAVVLGIVALLLLLTGIVGFCPLYLPFNISTNK